MDILPVKCVGPDTQGAVDEEFRRVVVGRRSDDRGHGRWRALSRSRATLGAFRAAGASSTGRGGHRRERKVNESRGGQQQGGISIAGQGGRQGDIYKFRELDLKRLDSVSERNEQFRTVG